MTKEDLLKLKEYLSNLSDEEKKKHNLHLRRLATGEEQGPLTGFPSIDKPWLKYYSEDALLTEKFQGNCLDYLKYMNRNRLYTPAIQYFDTTMSYHEFFNRIDVIARSFMEMGVKQGDIVTLALPNIPENLIALYALNKIGAIANIIDLRLKGEKLQKAINRTGSKFIVACDLFSDNLDEIIEETSISKAVIASPSDSLNPVLRTLYKIKNHKSKLKNIDSITWKQFYQKGILSSKESSYVSKPDDTICILYTSGTTGDSKGVVFTNNNFNAMAEQLKNCGFGVDAGHIFLNQVPPFLVFNTLIASHFPLSRGVKLRMLPDYQPDKFYANIYKYKPNHTVAGPADWNSFTENPVARGRKYDYLMTMVSGSDKINEKKKEEADRIFAAGGSKSRITEGYGMTEVGAAAVTNLPQINVRGSVGIPLPDFNICIYDNDRDCELGYNEIGEICFSGPTVMKEYFNNPEATKDSIRFHGDCFWMHSGDLGYIDENGSIYLKGRLKRIVVRYDGIKVSPLDIENVISSNSIVDTCCVVGVDDREHGFGSVPVAFVTLNDDVIADEENIKEFILNSCKDQLSEKYLPNDIIIKKELPYTPVGKIDYRKLIEEYNANNKFVKRR